MKTKQIATYGMMVSLAFILSYVESMLPIPVPIPGIKIGLANLVVIAALYLINEKAAWTLSIIRIVLVGFTFGSVSTMMFSIGGGIVSLLLMIVAKRLNWFSMLGVSILGGIGHNTGQIIVAMFVVNSGALIYYLPFLIISGLVTGAVIGMIAAMVTTRIRPVFRE